MNAPRCGRAPAVGSLGLLLLLLAACEPEPTPAPKPAAPAARPATEIQITDLDREMQGLLSRHLQDRYGKAEQAAATLCAGIDQLLEKPNRANLSLTRSHWLAAHHRYRAAHTMHSLLESTSDQQLDAWPVLGGYIDRAPGYPRSGIVYDTTLEITPAALSEQHQLTDTSEVSIGLHAMEYLLWGDPDDTPRDEKLFQVPADAVDPERQGVQRRRDYLRTLCRMFTAELASVHAAAPSAAATSALETKALLHRVSQWLSVGLFQSARQLTEPDAETECAFSGVRRCGLAPTLEALLFVTSHPSLQAAIESADAGIAESIQLQVTELETMLDSFEAGLSEAEGEERKFLLTLATALKNFGDEVKAAGRALPGS